MVRVGQNWQTGDLLRGLWVVVISVRFRVHAHPLRRSGLALRVAWVHPSTQSTRPIVDLPGPGDGNVPFRLKSTQ